MTTKEKIKQYIDSKGISKNKFYTITGFSSTFLDSGNTIGVDKAKIIIEKFPDISIEWLILDRGEMLRNDNKPAGQNAKNEERIDKLLGIISDQQQTIKTQSLTIEELTKKVGNDVSHRAAKVGGKG